MNQLLIETSATRGRGGETAIRDPFAAAVARSDRSGALRELAAELLDHQLGLFGRDVESPVGNLLVAAGFERIAPPVGRKVPSLYRATTPEGDRVILRGFGIFFGRPGFGGLFVGRDAFAPRFASEAEPVRTPWESDDLPEFLPPASAEAARRFSLTTRLIEWLASYEAAVIERAGPEHRRRAHETVLARRGKATRLAEDLPRIAWLWRRLGACVAARPELFHGPARLAARASRRRLARRAG